MPIGNLTSQVFANLYLNELDQYCKQRLGVKYYMRYMDDVMVLGSEPAWLYQVWAEVETYLASSLGLRLNKKTCIRSAAQGVEFCGFRIWPTKVKLKKKTALRMRRAVRGIIKHRSASAMAALRSYGGLTKHISGCGLKRIVSDAITELQN